MSSVDRIPLSGAEILSHAMDHNFVASQNDPGQFRVDAHRIMSEIRWSLNADARRALARQAA